MMTDAATLSTSHAGMRLIALLTLYNKGSFDRLRTYFKQHFTAEALNEEPVAARLAALKMLASEAGKLRLRQLVASDKHRAIALFDAQNGGLLMMDIEVLEAYPHLISTFTFVRIEERGEAE